ncbi:MAG: UvrD-helicase domain-containing protein [Planctomycetota bacterium]|jgi:ATP-dependent exoDNAse (exonuclease V) beta subunit
MNLSLDSCVLMASAGTGKTFQLSSRYLRLAQQGAPVEGILASTFTRKAAGEILGAIVGRLAIACQGAKEFEELSEQLQLQGQWQLEDAFALLRDLLRKLPALQVSTLDSWFQSQVRHAAMDLGLPLGWRLADDVEWAELHQDAIEKALEGRPTEQMVALLAAMQGGRPGRSVMRQASELWEKAATWWRACGKRPEAWDLLGGVERPKASEWEVGIETFRGLEIPKTGKGAPVKRWATDFPRAMEALEAKDWHGAFAKGILEKAALGENQYDRKEIERDRVAVLVDCYHRLLLSDLHASNLAFREMASVYSDCLEQLQSSRQLFYHDDFPLLLADCDEETRALVEKRGGSIANHLLLDEFQDTSVGQWHALDFPVRRALDTEKDGKGSVFVVGDLKQSIYGFRQGEPGLLAGLAGWFDLRSEVMAVNYRSVQTILDAVNKVFGGLQERHGQAGSPILDMALEKWKDFPEHRANNTGEGTFRILEAMEDKDAGVTKKDALFGTVVDRVVALHRAYPDRSLAVLVRGNREIPVLLAHLSAAGVRASMSGGNALTDARAVDVALSLLQLADHPGDTAAFFHVATSPMAEFLDLDFGTGEESLKAAGRLSRRIRRQLLEDGYGEVLRGWLEKIRAAELFDPWNRRRFEQLVELGADWEEHADLRPSRFVAMVRDQKVPDADVTKVQVMTVHQSKGLAFDMVVLPFKPDRRFRDEFITERPDPRAAVTAVSRRPKDAHLAAAKSLDNPRFLEAQMASEATSLFEDLCVLYVAMTRAKVHMELILPVPPKSPKLKPHWIDTTELLRQTLLVEESEAGLPQLPTRLDCGGSWQVLWQTHGMGRDHGIDLDTDLPDEGLEETLEQKLAFGIRLSQTQPLLAESDGKRSLPRWTPSGAAEEKGSTRATDLFAAADDTARRRGTAIHRLFEEVTWVEDFQMDSAALCDLLAGLESPPSAKEASAWCEQFEQSLQLPTVRRSLSPPQVEGLEFELQNELPFAVPTMDPHGQPAILQGIFDRVVLHRRDGEVIAADVVDFKTGASPADGEMSASYRAQMEAYRRALSVQHGIEEEQVSCRLLFVDDGVECVLR